MATPIQHLIDCDLLRIAGRDAAAFLQSLLSNDLRVLDAEHNAQWTALLTPQGRVIALMALILRSDSEFLLAVPKQRGEELRQTLQRFILRRKLDLTLATDAALLGTLGNDPAAPGTPLSLGFRSGRHWYLCTPAEADKYPAAGDDWRLRDLEDGLAFLDADASEKFLAQALALHALPAVSMNKGCYPGQEIVSRSHYLGKNKRRLALLDAPRHNASPPLIGAPLHDDQDKHVGDVVAAVVGSDVTTLLAVLTEAGLGGKLLLPNDGGHSRPLQLRQVFEQT